VVDEAVAVAVESAPVCFKAPCYSHPAFTLEWAEQHGSHSGRYAFWGPLIRAV